MPRWEIEVASDGPPVEPRLADRVAAAIRAVLSAESAGEAEISVAMLSNKAIRSIHRDYLGDDTPTDVITFPLREPGRPLLGDIYIGVEQAAAQAEELGIDAEEEILRLAVHASLHLLGWDHPEGDDRTHSPMYVRQEELLRRFLLDEPGGNRPGGSPR